MRVLVLVAVAGCYAPTPPSGVACTTACPGDEVCIDGYCRSEPPTGDAAVDAAPDTAIDAAAACANAALHDEDSDGIDDACDPCPHIAGTLADGDSDGVGDACDPEPAIPRQRLAVSIRFARAMPRG